MPGYCVSGTVGAKVLSGAKRVEIEKGQMIDVKLSVQVRFIFSFAICHFTVCNLSFVGFSICRSAPTLTPRVLCN